VLPSGSRNQNIGGTGPPMRDTSGSVSTPAELSSAWTASMSFVVSATFVFPPVSKPSRGEVSASAVAAYVT
jgi:hypothetical protein